MYEESTSPSDPIMLRNLPSSISDQPFAIITRVVLEWLGAANGLFGHPIQTSRPKSSFAVPDGTRKLLNTHSHDPLPEFP